ncbi:MAG: hypothetical protein JWO96_588 [Candidatus Saccharibacteria bacterium]|nr:hypothetical protein [Candidatus Saccharibacteria bacterium]
MVLKHFEPSKDYSWDDLDEITHKPRDLWTWPMAGLTWLATNGYTVINVESFDYAKFMAEGSVYMQELWGREVVAEQVKHSDIPMAQSDVPAFLENVNIQNDIPNIHQIRSYLRDGYLVICNVNARKLNMKPGFVGHSVLVIGEDEDNLLIHDPGLPPLENRKVIDSLFEQAWADPNDSAKSLAAIKRAKQ